MPDEYHVKVTRESLGKAVTDPGHPRRLPLLREAERLRGGSGAVTRERLGNLRPLTDT